MKCLRCQNTDFKYFGYDHGTYYCRKCIAFGRLDVGQTAKIPALSKRVWKGTPKLKYELTSAQKKASAEVLAYLRAKKDVFVYAATGAGKTEMTFESICWYLSKGKKVCFAISRRQVVLEIAQRLRVAFPELKVVEVCQGYTEDTDGDLIVCTTHQLYRYPQCFDLLILDELDAFPYVGNDLLQEISCQSCRGEKLLLSATPDEESRRKIKKHEMEMVCLFERPHKHPLCVPKVRVCPIGLQYLILMSFVLKCKKKKKQVLVFVPEKQDCIKVKLFLAGFTKVTYVHSGVIDKDLRMKEFKKRNYQVMISTTLLERGITIEGVQVIVLQGQHIVFTVASLIQIFGRVGRSFQDPEGEGICLCQYQNSEIKECIRQILWMNEHVFSASVKKKI